jgi:CBS domain-containing protein
MCRDVPALLAAAAAQLTMGRNSFSAYQRTERGPDLEPLTRLAVAEIMSPNADTVDADLPLDEVVPAMLRQNRRWAPVTENGRYLGLIAVADIAAVAAPEWPTTTARDVVRTDVLPAASDEPVPVVAARIRAAGADAAAVTDGDRVVGVVTLRDLTNVEALLDRLETQP